MGRRRGPHRPLRGASAPPGVRPEGCWAPQQEGLTCPLAELVLLGIMWAFQGHFLGGTPQPHQPRSQGPVRTAAPAVPRRVSGSRPTPMEPSPSCWRWGHGLQGAVESQPSPFPTAALGREAEAWGGSRSTPVPATWHASAPSLKQAVGSPLLPWCSREQRPGVHRHTAGQPPLSQLGTSGWSPAHCCATWGCPVLTSAPRPPCCVCCVSSDLSVSF